MQYTSRLLSLGGAAVALAGFLSAGGSAQNPPANAPQAPQTDQAAKGAPEGMTPASLTLKTDKKTYAVNEPIKMTLTVKNTRKDPVTLHFASGQKYDIEIRQGKGRNGAKVWQWSRGMMFTQMVTAVTLAPGKKQTYTETYKPGDARMPPLTPGTYTVIAIVTTMGRDPRPYDMAPITVR
jgi:hypothetical protein